MASSQFFLGANTPAGFFSFYDHLVDRSSVRAVYLLKGGAGCGKSSFMRRIAHHAESIGMEVEYIRCSGDPDSLDAVSIPSLGMAIADATAPHVLEPVCPGVIDHYINLERFYDSEGLQSHRDDILSCMGDHKTAYRECYLCLKAAGTLLEEVHELIRPELLESKLAKRAKGIIGRELRVRKPLVGKISPRFLSAITCEGLVTLWETLTDSYKRIYVLNDSFGISHLLLDPICSAAVERGYDVIPCFSPLATARLEHLLIPEAGLAFVSPSAETPFPGKPYRRIHLDTLISSSETYRQNRSRIRFTKKVASSLLSEAFSALSHAKHLHDRLERIYNPYVDFESVYAEADALASHWFPQQIKASP